MKNKIALFLSLCAFSFNSFAAIINTAIGVSSITVLYAIPSTSSGTQKTRVLRIVSDGTTYTGDNTVCKNPGTAIEINETSLKTKLGLTDATAASLFDNFVNVATAAYTSKSKLSISSTDNYYSNFVGLCTGADGMSF